jgi:hypothetical protein
LFVGHGIISCLVWLGCWARNAGIGSIIAGANIL